MLSLPASLLNRANLGGYTATLLWWSFVSPSPLPSHGNISSFSQQLPLKNLHLDSRLSLVLLFLIRGLVRNDKGDALNASYYHTVSPLTNTAIGAELSRSFSSNDNTLTQLLAQSCRIVVFFLFYILSEHLKCNRFFLAPIM
ncbi:hypothetical protein I3843_06G167900 [Carya illinoinensis]|nr:hypothetical protein I3843_06G167900 [Carya illinoinensis]